MTLEYTWKNAIDVARALARRGAWRERETWSRERLEAWQRARLGELVEYASERSAFYRDLYGGRVGRHEVRLEALPPVTKAMMMDRFDSFVTDPRLHRPALERHLETIGPRDELFLGEFRVLASSGSSGRKGIYVFDRRAWTDFLGGVLRWSGILGLTPRFPRRRRIAQVAAPDAKHMTSRGAASMSVGLFLPLRLSATQPLDELVACLNRQQPEALSGYPSMLALLAVEQLEGRLRIAPKTLSTSSEVCTAEMTSRMREAWGLVPFDCLGMTETGITASECEYHRGLHIFEDACIYEVVDERGRAVPPGQQGERVLLTNLYNRTQPFVRFEITDLVTIADDPCPCGRTFRRITGIEGRSDDILDLPAAAGGVVRVHPIHLRSPLAAAAEIAQYQIVQREDGLDVTIALSRGASADASVPQVRSLLLAKLASLGAAPLDVRVSVVAHIDREGSAGKFKLIKKMSAGERPDPGVVIPATRRP